MQEWITGQEVMDEFDLTRNEWNELILSRVLAPYLLDANRVWRDGAFHKQYEPFAEYQAQHEPRSFAYVVEHTSPAILFVKKSEAESALLPPAERWRALLDTKLTDRQRNVVQAVLMKINGASHKEILEKLYPGQEKPNSVVSQWKEVAEKLAAKQTPPLDVPPWES